MDNSKRYNFWPGSFHVERGAFVIAVVGTALSLVTMVLALIRLDAVNFLGGVLNLLVNAAIFFAQRRRQPAFYLPFIFSIAISTIFTVLATIVAIVYAIFLPAVAQQINNNGEDQPPATEPVDTTGARIFWTCFAIFFALLTLFDAWLAWIVWRAREYMVITNAAASAAAASDPAQKI